MIISTFAKKKFLSITVLFHPFLYFEIFEPHNLIKNPFEMSLVSGKKALACAVENIKVIFSKFFQDVIDNALQKYSF